MPVATKKLRSNRAWIERHINDPFVKRSRQEGYRARSLYTLIAHNEKEKLIRPGMCVVDLGAAPGSWTQVVREKLAGKDGEVRGTIIAMDILPMVQPTNSTAPTGGVQSPIARFNTIMTPN